jgi:hypothetical protein
MCSGADSVFIIIPQSRIPSTAVTANSCVIIGLFSVLDRHGAKICGLIDFTFPAYSPLHISGSLQAFALAPAARARSSPRTARRTALPRGRPLDLSRRGPSTAGAQGGRRCRRPAAGRTCRTACTALRRTCTAARSMDGTDASPGQGTSQRPDRLHSAVTYKRLSQGKFRWWPDGRGQGARSLEAHELQLLLWNGNPERSGAAPMWRPVAVRA